MYLTVGQIKHKTRLLTQILLQNETNKGGKVARERKGLQAYHLVGRSESGPASSGFAVTDINNAPYFA